MADDGFGAPVREVSQTRRAHGALQQRIVDLELEPGLVVSEKLLAATLGLGRTPVREALRELAREGLVVVLPQRGIVIAEIDAAAQLSLLEWHCALLRFAVEAQPSGLTLDPDSLERQARALRAAAKDRNFADFVERDGALQQAFVSASQNAHARAAFTLSDARARRYWRARLEAPADLDALAEAGAAAAETCALNGDVMAAIAAWIGVKRAIVARDMADA